MVMIMLSYGGWFIGDYSVRKLTYSVICFKLIIIQRYPPYGPCGRYDFTSFVQNMDSDVYSRGLLPLN